MYNAIVSHPLVQNPATAVIILMMSVAVLAVLASIMWPAPNSKQ